MADIVIGSLCINCLTFYPDPDGLDLGSIDLDLSYPVTVKDKCDKCAPGGL